MHIEIRQAKVNDAPLIAKMIGYAFDDEPDLDRVIRQIMVSNTMIHVAVVEGQVTGFVENFVTRSHDNKLRLELDLLAVHPDMQGNGIGRQLIRHSIKIARSLGVHHIRALIATTNAPMHHLCGRFKMIQDDFDSGLYIKLPSHSQVEFYSNDEAHFIKVNTLTYDGIWLEGKLSQATISTVLSLANTMGLDIVGIVYPTLDTEGTQLLKQNEFIHINDYRRWTLNLRND